MNERIKYLFALSFLIFFPIAWEIQQPAFHFLGMGLFTFLGVVWLVIRSRSAEDFRIPKFLLVILVFMVLQVVLLPITPVKATGYYKLILELYIFFFFIIILDNTNNPLRRRFWENALIGASVVYAAIEIIYMLSWYASWWDINGSLFPLPPIILRSPGILLAHPNVISGYLTLVTPLALVRLLGAEKRSGRVFWAEILLILLVANFFTYSRGGWLSLAGALLVALGLYYRQIWIFRWNLWSKIQQGSFGKVHYIGIGLLTLVLLSAAILISQLMQSTPHGSFQERLDIYSYAIRWISNSPIIGQGTGSVPSLFALRGYAIGGDEIYHAHNFWLQIALESGLFGLLLIIIAAGFILWGYRSSWLKWHGDPLPRASLAAYAGVGTAFLIHSMLDYLIWKAAYALTVAIIIALVYSLASRTEFIILRKRITIVILGLVLLVSAAGLVFIKRSRPQYWDGKVAAAEWDWLNAREKLCLAADLSPDNAFYSFQCSLANAYVADLNRDPDALADALRYQNNALALDPNWYIHWANLSSYEWQLGEFDAAFSHMQKAIDLAPNRTFLQVSLAWMAEQSGDSAQAFQSYQTAYCRNPGYQNTLLFQESPIFQQAAQKECPAEFGGISSINYLSNMRAGQQALNSGDLLIAEQHFQNAISANKQSGTAYAYLALVHHQDGNLDQSRKDLQTAKFIEGNSVVIQKIAANIAFLDGNQRQGYEHLSQAFLNLQNNSLSSKYYNSTYFVAGLPSDLSPFIPSTMSPERVKLFEQLAAYLAEQGDHQYSQWIRQWLEIKKSP